MCSALSGLGRDTGNYTPQSLSSIAGKLASPIKRNRVSRCMWTCLGLEKSEHKFSEESHISQNFQSVRGQERLWLGYVDFHGEIPQEQLLLKNNPVVQKGRSSLRLPGSQRGSNKGSLQQSVQTSVLGPALDNRIINYLKIITFTADNL